MLDIKMQEQKVSHNEGLEKLEEDFKEEVSTLKAFANDIKSRI